MLPGHQIYSGSQSYDTTDSLSLPQSNNSFGIDLRQLQQSNTATTNLETRNVDHDELLKFLHQPNTYFDSDSDNSGVADTSNNKQDRSVDQIADANIEVDHHLEPSLVPNPPSELPALSNLNERGRLHQLEGARIDNRNKRQKLRQSQSSQDHPLKNDLYPISSKNWSPQSMETPPASTTERSDSGKLFDKIKAYELQVIPPYRRKEPLKKLQMKENQTPSKDKENASISTNHPNVHFHQQSNGNGLNSYRRDNQHSIKQPLQRKVTNGSKSPRRTQKLSIYRDDDDDNGYNNNGSMNSNRKEIVVPLSSVNVNQSDRQQSYIESNHAKQQHGLDQRKNDGAPALSDREHQQEEGTESHKARSTKDKKILTGELQVNEQVYTILNIIGQGGSGAVYRVLHHESKEILALKHVETADLARQTTRDYRNEINFLYQLRKSRCAHIPLLYNYEYNRFTGDLNIVLELGEIDFASYMGMQKSKPLNMNFVRWYGQQMLEAVAEIHDKNVVHRDLKPANFILKEGSLKLIDFGISKKLRHHTGTVDIDTPTGTVNYMPPEAFISIGSGPGKHTRIGRPADIWALGCILYQMIYGRTPFHRIPSDKRAQCIRDPSFKIDYPYVVHFNPTKNNQDDDETAHSTRKPTHISIGKDTLNILQSCLNYDPLLRLSAKELLEHPFFYPSSSTL